ncbi:pyrimidine 5'-nucleotidase [uncultured Hyphomicrobium sp.]|jgi:putative hydrolase of the HAD superfamily|uniref:pyrimidine 5'-nucleotidase n=1 Tax=uncultured Hyphomicrobium sp. TaxID=194373 RepID=UPI0025F82D4D|nr:pyrimidine 5'-nucleotidase [uncultured Hyphomicrobium sp.]
MTAGRATKQPPEAAGAGKPALLAPRAGQLPRGFDRTDIWIFDLDNTLYPAECNLFAEVDRRMGEFIARYLGVPLVYARHLQKTYYRQFGTTLAGLMKIHKLDPAEYLAYVHDIDLSAIQASPALRAEIEALPGRRLIFTNGSYRHAERVAEKLGVLDLFEDICDVAACAYVPKPEADAFQRMISRHSVDATRAAMFEDMPMNLAVPHDLGMTTVLVHSSYLDHPVQQQMKTWTELPDHIHHMTLDLTAFLKERPGRIDQVHAKEPQPG